MKYIVCEEPDRFELKTKEAPAFSEGNALLKVKRVGICGTDLHAFKGNQPFFSYPRILGHELATEVVEVGENHQGISVGDRVVIMPYINCQECDACKAGKSNCCENIKVFGVHTDGGMQEVISLPTRLLLKANDLTFEEIAIVEPLAIGAHALRRADIKSRDVVVVMGCGPIGIGIIQLAKYLGAEVIAIDINDHRLKMVKEQFGADHIVNALEDPVEKVKEITNGRLANSVFDATGSKRAIEGGTDYMRHGGNYVLVGLFKGDLTFTHPKIHAKETTLMCSRNATLYDFEFVMKVLSEGEFNTEAYITSKVPFETILTGFDAWTSPESKEIKVVTTLD
ncbi:zinc-binding alcohol dehydrogenase family protein [Marinoscillum sp. MHG1-6]|uniref:zinc-binding alcohol dehydrogenase family protein n=1 Tax=Marinoscillum sp. MHG1-6 TaxID=2959627 RepID=UPI00215885B8|nr:zinc-binding alcohol dehydrogenase family protein [Marinoscillum sp. MHG1-6]